MDKRPPQIRPLAPQSGALRDTIRNFHPNVQRGIIVTAVAAMVSGLVLAGPTVNFGVAPVVVTAGIDFGDAPNDLSSIDASLVNIYPTTLAANGARHTIDGLTYLGAGISAEANGVPGVNADSDTQDDGVTFPLVGTTRVLVSGQNNTLNIVASKTGLLNAWIDWNQDGDWLDAGEQIATDLALSAGSNSITLNPNVNDPHGTTYARFRFSTDSGLTPTGLAANGEVEDYKLNVVLPTVTGCTNAMLNTGFESNPVSGYNIFPETSVPGWGTVPVFANSGSGFGFRNSIEIWQSGFQGVPSFEGTYFAELNANVDGRLYQDMLLPAGTIVRWQLAHHGRKGTDTASVSLGSADALVTQATFSTPNTTWGVYSGQYTVPAGQDITRFATQAVASASGNVSEGNFVDDVRLTFVCPPAVTGYKSVKLTNDVNGNGLADPADTLTWTVQYKNSGTGPAGAFQINDPLPAGLTLSSTGAQVVTTTGTGTIAVKNSSYTGMGTTTANLLSSGASLDVGGVISISLPTTVNSGFVGSIQNQATATTSDLTTPALTDNVDTTTTGLPTGIAIPAGSISQTQGPATDATSLSVVPPPVTVSGKVWNDANASLTIDGNPIEAGTNASGLTVYAVDALGNVISKATVAIDGTYTLSSVPQNSSLTLRLSTDSSIAVGALAPATSSLPNGWVNTGENLNGTTEPTTPGEIAISTGTTDLSGFNFGIEQTPTANPVPASSQANPGGNLQIVVPTLGGTDPEDGTLGNGNTIIISSIPTNGKLYYNGIEITAAQIAAQINTGGLMIPNYDPSKLKLDPDNGALTVTFDYKVRDAAGQNSAPATVTMPFTNLPPEAANVTNDPISSTAGPTTLANGLSATDPDGSISSYTITSLPDPSQGKLFMSDGTTPVALGQVLTTLEAAGLKFDPSGTYNGPVSFKYTATDNNAVIDSSDATYTIPVGNNPPTATDVNNASIPSTAGVTPISGLVASDTDGTISTYTILSLPPISQGVLYMPDGITKVLKDQVLNAFEAANLKFDPSGTYSGDVKILFTATDNDTAIAPTPATLTIPIGNNPPSSDDINNPVISIAAGPTAISSLNATDTDGTIATYTILSLPDPTHGVLYLADGITRVQANTPLNALEAASLKFDPTGTYTGPASFTYTATDNLSASDATFATFNIPIQNLPPVAKDVLSATIPSTAGPTGISGLNAIDTDGTIATYTILSLPDPTHGVLLMPDGLTPVLKDQILNLLEAANLKFDPNPSFTGNASFTFTATDNNNAIATTPATLTIPVGNNPPDAKDVNAPSIPSNAGPTAIPSLNATDTDGTVETYTILSLPDLTHGTLYMPDGTTPVQINTPLTPLEIAGLKFDPLGTYNGPTSFTYTATDNNTASDPIPATVKIPIGNTPPTATDTGTSSIPSNAGPSPITSLAASDPDGTVDSYTVTQLPDPTQGVLYMPDGLTPVNINQPLTPFEAANLKFDPSGTVNGPVTFKFTATDNNTATDATPALYTIPLGNTPPIANDVTSATLPSTAGPTAISSLSASDPDGSIANYTITSLPDPSQGVLLMPDGITPVSINQPLTPLEAASLKFDPNPGFTGAATFKFTATDNNTAIDPSDATLTIPVGNNPPTAIDVNNLGIPSTNGPTSISSLNASDTDGTIKTYTITSLPDPLQGTLYMPDGITPVQINTPLTLLEAAGLKFDPSGSFIGDATFKFTATDNNNAVDASPATFTIPVQPGITVSGTVWNDGDGNGAQIGSEPGTKARGAFAILTDSSGTVLQVVAVANDGTYSFAGVTPNTDLKVLISSSNPSIGSNFTTPITPNGFTNTTPSSLSFNSGIGNVSGKNFGLDQTPVAVASSVPAQSNPAGTGTVVVPSTAFTGTDADGKVTTYTITGFPSNVDSITISVAGTTTTYTPSNFPGTGVNIPANPDGTLPADAISIDPKDGAITVQIPFSVTDNAGKTSPASSVDLPFNTVSISGKVWDDADANQAQTANEPGTNASGINAVLTDSSGKVLAVVPINSDGTYRFPSAPANTDLKVLVSSENPAIGGTYSTPITPVNWTNTTPSGLSFKTGTTPVTDKNFGLEQLPNTDAKTLNGLSDLGGTNTVLVPALTGSDPEDGTLAAGKIFVIVDVPTNGTLIYDGAPVLANTTISNYDPAKLVFNPNDDVLTSSFTVAAVDAAGKPDATPATVTLNFKPVAKPDLGSTPAETPVQIAVLTNDSSTLTTITGTTAPANGTVIVNPDGTITYKPNPGFSGTDSFTYTACDGSTPAQCSTSTVTVQVTPAATPDSASTAKNNPVKIAVLENDKGKLDPASVTITTPPAHGSLIVNPDGTITYKPATDYEGADSFTYQVCDLNTPAQCTTASVDLNVSPNNPPVAQDRLEPKINSDVTLPLAPLAAIDTDGTIKDYTFTALPSSNQGVLYLGDPANGGTPVSANQVLTPAEASRLFFKPNPNFGGEASFKFTATDNFGAKDAMPATVRIQVNAVPQSTNDTTSTPLNTPVTIPILENDKDVDGTLDLNTIDLDPSTPEIDKVLSVPNKGTFTATPDGKVSFVPDPSFSGTVTVPYSVNDNTGARSNTSSITVNVQAGQIYGHVFSDLNGNGTQDAGEPDLQNVPVKITPEGKPSFTVKTDANGNYGANVPPGNVTADVSNPSNTRLTTGNDPQTVTVTAGTNTNATPVGFQPLEGNLTGRIFNDANGNGVQDDGELGLEGVNVKITDAQGKVTEVTTDANGDYRVSNAAAGNATIEATDPNGQVLTTNNNPQTVNVKAGSSSNATLVGYVTPSIGIQKRALTTEVSVGSSLEYEIVVTNTSPVALRDVTVIDELPVGLAYKTGTSKLGNVALEPVISIKAGRQVLTWILTGELAPDAQATLRFTTTVTPNAGTKLENVAFANGVSGSTSSPVSTGKVKSAVAATVVKIATFTDKTALVGRVYFDKDQDRNFDASKDEPFAGARVYLSDGRYAITDTQGRYNFAELEPGEHVVRLDPLTAPYKAESIPEDRGLRGTRMIVARGGLQTADFPLIAPDGDVLKVRSTTVKRGPVTLEKGLVEAGAGYAVSIKLQITAPVQDLRLIDPLPTNATRGEIQLVRNGEVTVLKPDADGNILIPGTLEAGTYELRYAIFTDLPADLVITDPSIRYTEVIR